MFYWLYVDVVFLFEENTLWILNNTTGWPLPKTTEFTQKTFNNFRQNGKTRKIWNILSFISYFTQNEWLSNAGPHRMRFCHVTKRERGQMNSIFSGRLVKSLKLKQYAQSEQK